MPAATEDVVRDFWLRSMARLGEMWMRANVNSSDETVRRYSARLRECAVDEAKHIANNVLKEPDLYEKWIRFLEKEGNAA